MFSSYHTTPRKVAGIHDLNSQSATDAQLAALTKQVELLVRTQMQGVNAIQATMICKNYGANPRHHIKLQKHILDKQFTKFLEVFRKLHINILFADALAQMPSYAKFMNDILSNKRKLKEHETIFLTKDCSVILQKKTST
ncbi:Uncharacterized protein Adt_45765 [Abeliophyllum distichum]|uniref:Uncharacterized protein n=1 Tax=Abeliophyllum distichum TaxID=126358 RepID=A0ABD1PEP0_9LAMI